MRLAARTPGHRVLRMPLARVKREQTKRAHRDLLKTSQPLWNRMSRLKLLRGQSVVRVRPWRMLMIRKTPQPRRMQWLISRGLPLLRVAIVVWRANGQGPSLKDEVKV